MPQDNTGTHTLCRLPARAGAAAPADRGRLEIFDARGRRVRAVEGGRREGERFAIARDGRDDGGRTVARGVYQVRVRAGTELWTTRLAWIR